MKTVLRRCFEFAVLGIVTWLVWTEAGPATAAFAVWTTVMAVSLSRSMKENNRAWEALIAKLKGK